MIVLDTDVCIDLQRRIEPTLQAVERWEAKDRLAVTSITVQELVQGAYRSRSPDASLERLRSFLLAFDVLDYDGGAGWIAGRISADLIQTGRPIGDLDTMIAACVIAHRAALATRNPQHFERVRGLQVLDVTKT